MIDQFFDLSMSRSDDRVIVQPEKEEAKNVFKKMDQIEEDKEEEKVSDADLRRRKSSKITPRIQRQFSSRDLFLSRNKKLGDEKQDQNE